MLRSFDDSVRKVLQHHGVEDEKLEASLIDLFSQYEKRVLSDSFVEEIAKKLDRRDNRRKRSPRP
ncbi:hypothetical protein [Shouchella clausii]|uniref:Uncharacterized protein n=1 Tax=Shouchella clausii TaxID=79880 RepID=A0A268P5I5_SHOCL|nr:hypothetical protein [Shouchella clausii]PAE90948.1 hypothetical protein CHH72_00575 [Shouchella clausii]